MSYGYSNDLRDKALLYYKKSGASQQMVSEIFGISLRTLNEWVRCSKTEDYHRCETRRKRPHKIDADSLRAYIKTHPDAYLREIATHFNVSDVGIMKALRRVCISRKKNQPLL
jgi:transposase